MSDYDPFGGGQPPYQSRAARREANQLAERRRRQKRNSNLRVGIVLTLLLGLIGGGLFYGYHRIQGTVQGWFAPAADYPGPGGETVEIVIPPGASGSTMARILADADVVASTEAFTNAFRLNEHAQRIQPGTYLLRKQMRATDAVAALVAGERVENNITIPEGFTAQQVFNRIVANSDITNDDIIAALADPAAIGLPDVANGNPEGWLFPATYRIEPGTTATSLLADMVGRTMQELNTLGVAPADRESVLIKASLVEREARHDEDRPMVARAILNRIDAGMTLDIDAAVAYGLGISGTQLTRANLADPENPFNTYVHTGLPPGPIANPGTASIEAVTHPAEGPWLFWVTVNLATGETKFSSTYAEHQQYVAELREWQAANPDFGQAPTTDEGE